jgi:hypothetical protein
VISRVEVSGPKEGRLLWARSGHKYLRGVNDVVTIGGDPYSGALMVTGLVMLVVIGVPLGLLALLLAYKALRGSRAARWIILVLAVIGLGVGSYGASYDAFLYQCGSEYDCESRVGDVPTGYLAFAAVSAVVVVVAARALRRKDAAP